MQAFVKSVQRAYDQCVSIQVTGQSQPLTADIKRTLLREVEGNPYVLNGTRYLIESATNYHAFCGPSIELRLIGDVSQMDAVTCRKLCRRVSCIQRIYPTNPTSLVVWIVLCSEKRLMPEGGSIVEQKHINGGYTYIHGNEIYVLRREEFPKVVLHEVIHHTKLHFHDWDRQALRKLYDTFHISIDQCDPSMSTCSTNLAPNEAVVECWAEMFQLAFLSCECKLPFKRLYEREVQFAFMQASKIKRYQESYVRMWREKTHAYSYIVLRTLLLHTFDVWSRKAQSSVSLTNVILNTYLSSDIQRRLHSKACVSQTLRMTLFGDF